jgi:hypothetical protein
MFPSAPSGVPLLVAATCCLVAAAAARALAQPALSAPSLSWTRIAEAAPEDAPTALASDGGGRLVVGGARGVRALSSGGVPETVLRRGPVRDLAFLEDGSLLVATAQGLYRVGEAGEIEREALSTDAVSRAVTRLAAARGLAVAATPRGVFLRRSDARWVRAHALPSALVSLVALRGQGPDLELWSVIQGELWIAGLRLEEEGTGLSARRATLPVARGSEAAVDVGFDLPGADAVLCFPTSLVVRSAAGHWRRVRPSLPPGARVRRIAHAFGRLWLATDAGLLSAPRLEGPWQRAASPLGSLPVVGLAGGGPLAAATHRGVRVAAAAEAVGPLQGVPLRHVLREGPSVTSLHAAVIRQQGLETGYLREMRRRALRRGWLPELHVTLGYLDQRDRTRDYDQTFSSGDTRQLFDSEHDRGRDLDVALTLSWDLRDTLFHPDEIDLSRESRSVISLRDDVLDEVTQLYFERLRVLSRLEVTADASERQSLALRAAELAAGLDAWTGGRFSRAAP